MSKMTDAPENGLRRLTATAPADGIPAAAKAAPQSRNDLRGAARVYVLSGQTVAFQAGHLVHGSQIHSSVACRVGWTRVLCDPHRCRHENPDFNAPWS
jgi:hypothetical protein